LFKQQKKLTLFLLGGFSLLAGLMLIVTATMGMFARANDTPSMPAGAMTDGLPQISAGGIHSLAIDDTGMLWGWGLLVPNSSRITEPIEIGNKTDWAAIAAGEQHSLALDEQGKLWAWGANNSGQLGNGTTESLFEPTMIQPTKTWKAIATGESHSMAIDEDGRLYTWGWNSRGQLGDGTTGNANNKHVPALIQSVKKWNSISAKGQLSAALDENNKLFTWGGNAGSVPTKRGDNTYTTILATSNDVHALDNNSVYWYHQSGFNGFSTITDKWVTIAFVSGQTVTCLNNAGELYSFNAVTGNGVAVFTDKTWKPIFSSSGSHTMAVDSAGKLYTWGDNGSGQLGDGTYARRDIPIEIMTLMQVQLYTVAPPPDSGTGWILVS